MYLKLLLYKSVSALNAKVILWYIKDFSSLMENKINFKKKEKLYF